MAAVPPVEPAVPLERGPVPRGQALLLAVGLLVAAIAWFVWFHAWWLNSDGSSYLSIGFSFIKGHGFKLPDGSALSLWDRPAYPTLLTAPWLLHESLRVSIWMSRLPLILAAPIVAAATLRFTRSLTAAAFAGLAAIAQPWTLLAGGSNFVPDGLTAVALLGGVLCASIAVTSSRGRRWWLVGAVLSVLLASATKETGVLGFLLVGIVLWVGFARPRRWMVWVVLAGSIVAIVAMLVVTVGEPSSGVGSLPSEFAHRLGDEAFAGSSFVLVASVLVLALLAWALPRCTEPLPLAGLVLIAPGLALGLYASGSGLGLRNAAPLPYGACLLLGAFLGAWLTRGGSRLRVAVAVAGSVVLIVAFVGGSGARADRSSDVAARSWDSPATRAATAYLQKHAGNDRIGCTLQFCSFYWLHADGNLNVALLPQYSARLGPTSLGKLDYTERAGFRGADQGSPPCSGRALVVTMSDERFGTIFECPLLDAIRRQQTRYLVVSGWGGTDTFDAGRLIPYLEANRAFERVWSSAPGDWPRVIAVYKVVGDPRPLSAASSYFSDSAYQALRGDRSRSGATLLDGACYSQAIRALLAQPPGATRATGGGGANPPRCATTLH